MRDWVITTPTAIALGFVVSVAVYFVIAARCRDLNEGPAEFFYADLNISGRYFGSTYMGANVALTSIFIFLCAQATTSTWSALWAPIFWAIGVLLFGKLTHRLEHSFKSGRTIHQHLRETYQSPRLQIFTSAVTIFAFIGTIGLEFLGLIWFLSFFGISEPGIQIAIGFGLIVMMSLYMIMGGYWATIKTDFIQVILVIVGCFLLVSPFFPNLGIYPGVPAPNTIVDANKVLDTFSFKALFADPVLIVGFAVLFLPFQFSVMDMWQRCVATGGNINRIRRYIVVVGLILALIFTIPVMLGIFAVEAGLVNEVKPENTLFIIVKTFANPIVIAVIGIMFLASVFSTADTLLLAATNSLVCDLLTFRKGEYLTAGELNASPVTLNKCRLYVVILSLLTIVVVLVSLGPAGLTDIIFAVFAAQSILGVLVLVGLFLPERAKKMGQAAITAAILGLVLPIPIVIIGKVLDEVDLISAAPIISVLIAMIALFVIPARASKES